MFFSQLIVELTPELIPELILELILELIPELIPELTRELTPELIIKRLHGFSSLTPNRSSTLWFVMRKETATH